MTLYRTTADAFSAIEQTLVARLVEAMRTQTGRTPSPGERLSWERSLPALVADLRTAGLGDVEVLLEFQLPLTSKRARRRPRRPAPGDRRGVVRHRGAQAVERRDDLRGRRAARDHRRVRRATRHAPGGAGARLLRLPARLHRRARRRGRRARGGRVLAQRHRHRRRRSAPADAGRARSPLHRPAARRLPRVPAQPPRARGRRHAVRRPAGRQCGQAVQAAAQGGGARGPAARDVRPAR